jgi:hypothetical protein
MGIYGHEISFTYKKTFEADPEGFKKAQAEYDQAWQTYIIEKKKYDEWVKSARNQSA